MTWSIFSLQWRHNDQESVSNHQPHGCLLNRLLRSRSKKTSKLRVTGLCAGNSPGPVNSPHKGSVTWKNVSIWWRHHVPNPHKIHLIARPLQRGMGCSLCVLTVVYTLYQSLQWCMQYHVILDCVITALDCIWQIWCVAWGVTKNVLLFDTIALGVISFACLDMLVWSAIK